MSMFYFISECLIQLHVRLSGCCLADVRMVYQLIWQITSITTNIITAVIAGLIVDYEWYR
jgi:hypothetical protein